HLLKAAVIGAHVHVKAGDICLRVSVEHCQGLFGTERAANTRAERPPYAPVSRTDAEDDRHAVNSLAVRRPPDLTMGRSARVQEPLQLGRGHDVLIAPVAVLLDVRRVEGLESGGDDDCAHRLVRTVTQKGPEVRPLPLEALQHCPGADVDTARGAHVLFDLTGELGTVLETVVIKERERARQLAHPTT